MVTKNAGDRGGPVRSGGYLAGQGASQGEPRTGGKGSTRGIGSAVTTTGSARPPARPRRSPAPCRPYTRPPARPHARRIPILPPPFLLPSGPSNPLLPVPFPRPRLDPEGIPPGRPASPRFRTQLPRFVHSLPRPLSVPRECLGRFGSSGRFRPRDSPISVPSRLCLPALDWGAFRNRSRRLSRPERSNSAGFLLPSRSTAGGARPESGAEGVDATRRWIAEPSGVTRATARARPLRPRPRRRRPCPGRPRPRWGAPRTTSASARRCCRGAPRAARRARHTGGPSGGCSGRTPMGRSSPRSWNSSLVIQATPMMTTWILAYVQSCKYLDAESAVHPAQVESTSV